MLGLDECDVLVNEGDSNPLSLPGCLLVGRNLQTRREFRMLVGSPGPFLPLIPFGAPFLPVLPQIPCGFPSLFLFPNPLTDNPLHYQTFHPHYPLLSSY